MLPVLLSAFLLALLWAVVIYLKFPLGIAVMATAAVLVTWAGFLVWRRWRARKSSCDIDETLGSHAAAQASGARPDQQGEIEAMQAEFAKAVQALKSSKLARGGRDALALLPWYMIIGPPGGGKSTALRASGLKFPYLSRRGGVRGLGGTRNCEWWLTNEAVLLDTAGRYSTEDDDHEEWMGFLDMLARTRPKKPVNGILVAIPLVDVAAKTEEGASELGRRMRERVDEVMARLKMVLPVYVLLTKCDLLPGFVETFGDLPKVERGQVWGFTVPLGELADKAAVFGERFDELLAAVEERSLWRLGEQRQLARRERIYEFPQQLGAAKPALAEFLDALFTENVYQDTPILRGVYFTSGTQEGRVVDRVMTRMAEAFGVRPALGEAEPVLEAKSYFLRDVFARVIIPDQGIAFRNARAVRRDEVRRWALAGIAAGVAVLALFFLLRSFSWNWQLIQSTGDVAASVAGKLKDAGRGPPAVAELEPLRERLSLLVRLDEEGPPFALGLGMYRGELLSAHVRRIYAEAARRLLIDPVIGQDVEDMASFVRRLESSDAVPRQAEYARFYDALRLHLLLTAPRAPSEPRITVAEQAWIGERVARLWASRGSATADPSIPKRLGANAQVFARLLDDDSSLALPRYEDLVRRVRRVLSRLPLSSLAAEKLAASVDGRGYELDLSSVLGGPVPGLRASAGVPGAYTRRAYEEVLKNLLDNPASLVELWVTGGDGAQGQGGAGELERLRSRYYQRYVEEWQRFLESVRIDRDQVRPLALLRDLTSGEPTPLASLFRAVGYNTRIGGAAGTAAKAGQGVFDMIQGKLDPGGRTTEVASRVAERPEALVGPREVERRFAGFVAFGEALALTPTPTPTPAGGTAAPPRTLPLDTYQDQLSSVRDALQTLAEGGDRKDLVGRVAQARTRIQSLIDGQDLRWRPRLESLLWPPVNAAIDDLSRGACSSAARKWCSDVASPYHRDLASRYPFARDGEDAALAEIGDLFRPASGKLWAFYNEALHDAVQRSGDDYVSKPQFSNAAFRPELLPFLNRAQEIATVLFPPGASEPSVSFSVNVRPTPGIAAVFLDVDGSRVEYRNGPEEWHRITWPGKTPGASLRVRTADGREETLQRDGEWGLFRLLEGGSLKGEPRATSFAMAFDMQGLGAAVTIDFQTARSDTPFFGVRRGGRPRWLGPFRGGAAAPLEICRDGKGCAP